MQQILTPTGYVDISTIKVGDEVSAFDMNTGDPIVNTVLEVEYMPTEGEEYYIINGTQKFYKNQSIWANNRVVHMFELNVGDTLYDENNQDFTLDTLEVAEGEGWYRFQISNDHSYIVDDVTLHNASRFWVLGTGNWDAATTTNWAASSGTAGGQSVPTSSDTVDFDNSSSVANAAYTVTITATANCSNLTMLGPHPTNVNKVTWAGSSALNIFGNLNLSGGTAGITNSFTGAITYSATTTGKTVTHNGVTMASIITFSGAGGGWTLQDALNNGSSPITHTNGSLNTNGQTVTCAAFTPGTTGVRTLTLGASTINCTVWTALTQTNITFSGASSTINVTSTNFDGGDFSYGTVVLTANTVTMTGINTFVNLTMTPTSPSSTDTLTFSNNQTVTGTFTVSDGATVTNRVLVKSFTIGQQRTITAAAISTSNTDWQDIKGAGAASWDMHSDTGGSGDCGGNSMKALGAAAFTTAATQHWTNASSGSWSNASNWTSRVPLPQDSVVMDKAFGTSQTVTADMPRLGKNIDWTGATWTTALTFSNFTTSTMFGSLTLISGLTYSSASQILTLAGRGSFTIDTKTVTIGQPITLNAPGGTYTMSANMTMGVTRTLTITLGTFDTNASNYVLSVGLLSLGGGASGISATLNLNGATHLLTGTGTVFSATSSLSTSVLNAGTSTLKVNDTSNTAITIAHVKVLNNLYFSRGASTGTLNITFSGVYNDFKDDGTGTHTITFTQNTAQGIATFTVSGTSGHLITLNSASAGTKFTLLRKSGTNNCDYLSVKDSLVGGGATWNVGVNSTVSTGNYFGSTFGWADAGATNINRYWVTGGDGNWNNTNNWSSTSGGASGASVPIGEIAHFNASSGAGTSTVSAAQTCGDLDFTGFTGTLAGTFNLSIAGLLKFVSGMTNTYTGNFLFTGSGTSKTIDFSTYVGITAATFTGIDSLSISLFANNGFNDTWTLNSNMVGYTTTQITFTSGILDANGYNVTTGIFASVNSNVRTIKMGTGTWTLTSTGVVWDCSNSDGLTVVPSTSTVIMNNPTGSQKNFNGGGKTYYNLTFAGSGTGNFNIKDSNTFNIITINNPPHTFSADSGTTTSANSFVISGDSGNMNTFGFFNSTPSYLKQLVGQISTDYLYIINSSVIGTGFAGTHSVNGDSNTGNQGNNTNWIFAAPSAVIAGQVTLSGSGVSGAIVRLIDTASNLEVGNTTTDGSGNYTFYADTTKLYHVCVEYTSGGNKYNAKSLWSLTPV